MIKVLKESIPIERVKMKIKISMSMGDVKKCKEQIKELFISIISEDNDGQFELVRIKGWPRWDSNPRPEGPVP